MALLVVAAVSAARNGADAGDRSLRERSAFAPKTLPDLGGFGALDGTDEAYGFYTNARRATYPGLYDLNYYDYGYYGEDVDYSLYDNVEDGMRAEALEAALGDVAGGAMAKSVQYTYASSLETAEVDLVHEVMRRVGERLPASMTVRDNGAVLSHSGMYTYYDYDEEAEEMYAKVEDDALFVVHFPSNTLNFVAAPTGDVPTGTSSGAESRFMFDFADERMQAALQVHRYVAEAVAQVQGNLPDAQLRLGLHGLGDVFVPAGALFPNMTFNRAAYTSAQEVDEETRHYDPVVDGTPPVGPGGRRMCNRREAADAQELDPDVEIGVMNAFEREIVPPTLVLGVALALFPLLFIVHGEKSSGQTDFLLGLGVSQAARLVAWALTLFPLFLGSSLLAEIAFRIAQIPFVLALDFGIVTVTVLCLFLFAFAFVCFISVVTPPRPLFSFLLIFVYAIALTSAGFISSAGVRQTKSQNGQPSELTDAWISDGPRGATMAETVFLPATTFVAVFGHARELLAHSTHFLNRDEKETQAFFVDNQCNAMVEDSSIDGNYYRCFLRYDGSRREYHTNRTLAEFGPVHVRKRALWTGTYSWSNFHDYPRYMVVLKDGFLFEARDVTGTIYPPVSLVVENEEASCYYYVVAEGEGETDDGHFFLEGRYGPSGDALLGWILFSAALWFAAACAIAVCQRRVRLRGGLRQCLCPGRGTSNTPGGVAGHESLMTRADVTGDTIAISAENVSLRSFNFSLPPVSIDFCAGQVTAIVGPSGCGKSTLAELIIGERRPTAGRIVFRTAQGERVLDLTELRRDIGYCAQQDRLWLDLTARQHLQLVASLRRIAPTLAAEQSESLLEALMLSNRADAPVRTFSGGMKRRLSVAMAFLGDPGVCILDEPTTGLDPLSRDRVWKAIGRLRQGRIIVMSTNSMTEANAVASRVAIMHSGRLVAVNEPQALTSRFGGDFQVSLTVDVEKDVGAFANSVGAHFDQFASVLSVAGGRVLLTIADGNIRHAMPRLSELLASEWASEMGLKEWSFGTASLDAAFLRLAGVHFSEHALDDMSNRQQAQIEAHNAVPLLPVDPNESSASSNGESFTAVSDSESESTSASADDGGDEIRRVDVSPSEDPDSASASDSSSARQQSVPAAPPVVTLPDVRPVASSWRQVGPLLRANMGSRHTGFSIAELSVIILIAAIFAFTLDIQGSSCPFICNESGLAQFEVSRDPFFWGTELTGLSFNHVNNSHIDVRVVIVDDGEGILPTSDVLRVLRFPERLEYGDIHQNLMIHSYNKNVSTTDTVTTSVHVTRRTTEEVTWTLRETAAYRRAMVKGPPFHVDQVVSERMEADKALMANFVIDCAEYDPARGVADCDVTATSFRAPPSYQARNTTGRFGDEATTKRAEHTNVQVAYSLLGSVLSGQPAVSALLLMETSMWFTLDYDVHAVLMTVCFALPLPAMIFVLVHERRVGLFRLMQTMGVRFRAFLLAQLVQYLIPIVFLCIIFAVVLEMSDDPMRGSNFRVLLAFTLVGSAAAHYGTLLLIVAVASLPSTAVVFTATSLILSLVMAATLIHSWTGMALFLSFFVPPVGISQGISLALLSDHFDGRARRAAIVTLGIWFNAFWTLALGTYLMGLEFGVVGHVKRPAWLRRRAVRRDDPEAGTGRDLVQRDVDPRATEEAAQVRSLAASPEAAASSLMLVSDVGMTYPDGHVRALSSVSFRIRPGEVFALLGPNGSGKSTLQNIIIGNLRPTSGSCLVAGNDMSDAAMRRHALGRLGVVPQTDPLFPNLTAIGNVAFYARIKGMHVGGAKASASALLQSLGLPPAAAALACRRLSLPQRRLVSIAIALVGQPQLLLLDEPTTAMDPAVRQQVWRVLREAMRTSGMSVLLTSHEMAEVDALASRIAILGGGHVQALGSSQALKDKFGNGCTLSVRLGTANAQWDADELLCRILDEKLPGKLTKIASDAGDDEQWGPGGGSMTFALTGGVQPADILPHLPTLLGHTCDVPVREWQLSLSSLDDVFVRVAEGAAM